VAKALKPITVRGVRYTVLRLSHSARGPRFLLRDDQGRIFGAWSIVSRGILVPILSKFTHPTVGFCEVVLTLRAFSPRAWKDDGALSDEQATRRRSRGLSADAAASSRLSRHWSINTD
jgi:hypothetical protein